MEIIFDNLVQLFIENQVGIAQNFLNADIALRLKEHIMQLYIQDKLHEAGTGNNSLLQVNKKIRGDKIYWLDRKHNNAAENDFFDIIDTFVLYLNKTCYTGITGYEFHYTLYEEGSFYKKHIDQFQNDSGRAFSMITYLNPNWKENDGGELCIYHKEKTEYITPTHGKSVFFRSNELAHEVLCTHVPRLSITGWFKV